MELRTHRAQFRSGRHRKGRHRRPASGRGVAWSTGALLITAALGLAVAGVTLGDRPAGAAPNTPVAASAPVVLFTEDFEHATGSRPLPLTDYTGAAPAAATYTADPAWRTACNGLVVSRKAPPTPPAGAECGSYWNTAVRMAGVLGQWAGRHPATNHALIGYTEADPGGGVQLRAAAPVAFGTAGRFLTASLDVAARGCFAEHARLDVVLLRGETELPVSADPIDPCDNPDDVLDAVSVGRYTGDRPVLFPGSTVGVGVRNHQTSGNGNDTAIDNLAILDVTPRLDLRLDPVRAVTGDSVPLTFTVTNTTDLLVKSGWSFAVALPAGLTVTDPRTASTTCADGSVSGEAGGVSVSGGLNARQLSCTASVQVTAADAGTYRLCAEAVTERAGVDLAGCASVEFTAHPWASAHPAGR